MLILFSLVLFLNASDVSAATTNASGATAVSPKVTYTPSQINAAATKVKTFVDTNKRLPNYVTINNRQVSIPQFLLLLTYDVTQTNSGSAASITLKNVKPPTSPTETVKSGSLSKTEYVKIAQTVKSNINTAGKVPNYVNSSLGKIRYESLVYSFSKIMDYYAKNKKLPSTIPVTPWKANTNTEGTITQATNGTSFTISQICTAATNVKNYVDINGKIPASVTINNLKVTIPQFLQLLSYTITQLNSGSTTPITLKNITSPTNPTETVREGSLSKVEYVKLAQTVKSNISSTGKAPDNISSSLGKIRYESLVYIFSKTTSFYGTNKRLPNTLSVTPYIYNINVPDDVASVLNAIGKAEAQYEDIQGVSDLASFLRLGYGDCWADSLYLYTRLNAASIAVRIMGYVSGGSGVGYRHAWVQINIGNGWKNWNYTGYNSQHFGDVGCGTPYVLIGPGVSTPSIVATGY